MIFRIAVHKRSSRFACGQKERSFIGLMSTVTPNDTGTAVPVSLGVTVDIKPIKERSFCPQANLDERLWTAMRKIIPEFGYQISINSSLPMGRGMGSSAALSVALIREMARLNNRSMSLEEECDAAMHSRITFFF